MKHFNSKMETKMTKLFKATISNTAHHIAAFLYACIKIDFISDPITFSTFSRVVIQSNHKKFEINLRYVYSI
ncbi:hypothetical protein X798_02531 [Onchocerca flexuosa]|uniref:Uncharacterized protein n=1 Tax=Onchocerca flexuosa TaxID=387005 RepID=A0A238BYY1_9BILA|nr:hypothetical protein X798_02531 [Onchocerca flexuosa]